MTPSPIVGASAHRWPMDLRTDALRNHHPRMPQYSILVEKFVEDHYDEVFRYYARRLPSKEDAQDAT